MRDGDKQRIGELTTANGWNDLYKLHDDAAAKNYVIYKTFQELGATENELHSPTHIWNIWAMWARKQSAHDIADSVLWDVPSDENYVINSKVYGDFGDVIFALKKTPEGWKLNNVIHKAMPKNLRTHTSTKRNK
jgi:hypothetical protein